MLEYFVEHLSHHQEYDGVAADSQMISGPFYRLVHNATMVDEQPALNVVVVGVAVVMQLTLVPSEGVVYQ